MCGLACYACLGGGDNSRVDESVLRRMATAVAHRGPDAHEFHLDGPVGLGFARLSLVDPVGGGQPLLSKDGSLALIVNGEVYNHRELADKYVPRGALATRSDCEVLLHLYRLHGLRFLDEVRGMFALILSDRAAGRLVLARDRFGIKPLYYHRDAHRIVLASEMKALFADPGVPRRLDWAKSLASPILGAAPALTQPQLNTWFDGIEAIPAATILEVDLRDGATRAHKYWTFPEPALTLDASDTELIDRYRELLAESVTECATADTELGLFLSGGVDSASVAAIARATAPVLHTFSVLSPSTHLNGDAASAAAVANRLGLPNHQVVFARARVPTVSEWRRLLWLFENPMCGPEQFYKHELHRYAKKVRPELRGMLLGAAADEFMGGYSVGYSDGGGWDEFLGALTMMSRNGALRRYPEAAPWTGVSGRSLVSEAMLGVPDDVYPDYLKWEWAKVQQYNCWQEDRTAAGSGIEARVPFLDHRLVELAATLPPSRRETLLWDKRIVREAARPFLPPEIVEREKVPFYHGAGRSYTHDTFIRMLTQNKAELLEEALAGPGAADFLAADAIRATLASAQESLESATVELLLRLVNLGLLATMAEQQPAPLVQTRAQLASPPLELGDWLGADAGPDAGPVGGQALGSALGCRIFDHDTQLALADGVQFLTAPNDSQRCYVAVGGAVEYELDGDSPVWLGLFQSITENVSVSALRETLNAPDDMLMPVLTEAVDLGLVTIVGGEEDQANAAGP